MAIHVIVDTTELFRIPLLDAAGWKQLLAHSRRGDVHVRLPEVVLREASRHYEERIRGGLAQAGRALAKLRDVGLADTPDLDPTASHVDTLVKMYRPTVDTLLSAARASVLPLPNVSHEDMLNRDLAVRKPFRQNGKGYRDALVWDTLLEYGETCPERGTLYFVTSNTGDYCDSGESLLADVLQDEFNARCPNIEIVRVDSVAELLGETLKSYFEHLDDEDALVEDVLAERTLAELIHDAVVAASERIIGESVADLKDDQHARHGALLFDDVTPPGATEVRVTEVEADPESVDFSIYDQYDGDTVALHASVEAVVDFEAYMDKQLASQPDLLDEYLDDDEDGWEERHILVEFSRRVRLWFDLVTMGSDVETVAFDYAEAA